jgi:CubicO group peptidase (beta-lactamase class C family)
LFNRRPSIRDFILSLVLTVVLASCGTLSTTPTPVPSTLPAAVDRISVTPTNPDIVQQPTPTLASTLTQAPAISTQISPSNFAIEVDNLLDSYVVSGVFRGSVLIAREGVVLVSRGYGLADRGAGIPNTPETKFRLGSVTKMFTAAAVLLLQEQGKLNVQDAVCDYLADCPPAWQAVTIHHLLTHTSGIPDLTTFPEYPSWRATPSSPPETLNRFNGRPLDFPSGQAWRYSNSGYIVLGLIIEQAAGQPYEAFLRESIFTPLNMTASGYDHNLNELAVGYMRDVEADYIDMSIPFAAGGLYSTVEDLYRWDQALFNGALLTPDSLSQMFSEHAPIPGPEGLAYGYGWVIGQYSGHRVFEHRGAIEGFVSLFAHYPDDNVSIILLSNLQSTPLNALYTSLFNQVISDAG